MMRVMTGTKLRERIRTLSISIFFVGVVAVILSAAGVTLRVWNWVVILAAMFVVVFLIRRRQRTGGLPSAVAKAFRTRPPTIRDRLFFLVSAPAVIAAAVLFDWPLWGWSSSRASSVSCQLGWTYCRVASASEAVASPPRSLNCRGVTRAWQIGTA